jgi:hypothetical protein
VSTLNDLIDKSGKCYTWDIFKQKYDFNDNVEFFRHKSVINANPKTWKNNMSLKGEKLTDTIDKDIQQLKSLRKTGKIFLCTKNKRSCYCHCANKCGTKMGDHHRERNKQRNLDFLLQCYIYSHQGNKVTNVTDEDTS